MYEETYDKRGKVICKGFSQVFVERIISKVNSQISQSYCDTLIIFVQHLFCEISSVHMHMFCTTASAKDDKINNSVAFTPI